MKAKILKNERYSTGLNLNLIIFDEPEVLENVAKLSGEVDVMVKGLRHKRSKNANDYFWAIIDAMSKKTGIPKEEIYLEMLKKYGESVIVTVREDVDPGLIFKYYEFFDDGLKNGVKFVAYKVFIGSSQYDNKQMAKLIDGTSKEAKELGIQLELFSNEPTLNAAR